jgi:hypothetical protein
MKSDIHPSIGCSLCLLTGEKAMVIGYTFIIPHNQGLLAGYLIHITNLLGVGKCIME